MKSTEKEIELVQLSAKLVCDAPLLESITLLKTFIPLEVGNYFSTITLQSILRPNFYQDRERFFKKDKKLLDRMLSRHCNKDDKVHMMSLDNLEMIEKMAGILFAIREASISLFQLFPNEILSVIADFTTSLPGNYFILAMNETEYLGYDTSYYRRHNVLFKCPRNSKKEPEIDQYSIPLESLK